MFSIIDHALTVPSAECGREVSRRSADAAAARELPPASVKKWEVGSNRTGKGGSPSCFAGGAAGVDESTLVLCVFAWRRMVSG